MLACHESGSTPRLETCVRTITWMVSCDGGAREKATKLVNQGLVKQIPVSVVRRQGEMHTCLPGAKDQFTSARANSLVKVYGRQSEVLPAKERFSNQAAIPPLLGSISGLIYFVDDCLA